MPFDHEDIGIGGSRPTRVKCRIRPEMWDTWSRVRYGSHVPL